MFEYTIRILKEELKYHKQLDNVRFISQEGVEEMFELQEAIKVLQKSGRETS